MPKKIMPKKKNDYLDQQDKIMKLMILPTYKKKRSSPDALSKNGYIDQIVYLDNPQLVKKYISNADKQIFELHGHGLPLVYGPPSINEAKDKSPFQLADFFNENIENKQAQLTIDLRFCNSGSYALLKDDNTTICYAEDFSKAMYAHGFTNITTYGYSGFIVSDEGKEHKKQTLSSIEQRSNEKEEKGGLEDGRRIFKDNGVLIQDGKKCQKIQPKLSYTKENKNHTIRKDYTTYMAGYKSLFFKPKEQSNVSDNLKLEPSKSKIGTI